MAYEYTKHTPEELRDLAADKVEHYEHGSLGTQEVYASDLAALWRAIGSLGENHSAAVTESAPVDAVDPAYAPGTPEYDARELAEFRAARDAGSVATEAPPTVPTSDSPIV